MKEICFDRMALVRLLFRYILRYEKSLYKKRKVAMTAKKIGVIQQLIHTQSSTFVQNVTKVLKRL